MKRQGWYHWSQKGLRGTPERLRSDGEPEYAFYLKTNGAGDEFCGNREVMDTLFKADGKLDQTMLDNLHADIATLLFASNQRAMELNKAYWLIVREQSFRKGRARRLLPSAMCIRS